MSSGGRWRTVEHWVSRARMSLQMTEQLDLAGRTGEMVRLVCASLFTNKPSSCCCSAWHLACRDFEHRRDGLWPRAQSCCNGACS